MAVPQSFHEEFRPKTGAQGSLWTMVHAYSSDAVAEASCRGPEPIRSCSAGSAWTRSRKHESSSKSVA